MSAEACADRAGYGRLVALPIGVARREGATSTSTARTAESATNGRMQRDGGEGLVVRPVLVGDVALREVDGPVRPLDEGNLDLVFEGRRVAQGHDA